MDYHQNDNESWGWQNEDICVLKDADSVQKCAWTGVNLNDEDISYIFEESTPVKACGDLPYQFDDCVTMTKTPQECKEYSSQLKRRRILNFHNASEDVSSSALKSKERVDDMDNFVPEIWEANLPEAITSTDLERLGQSEDWLADCLNDMDCNISSDDGNGSISSGVQISTEEVGNVAPDHGSITVQRPVRSSRKITFRGRKSYMRTSSKLTSSVVYPFDFIKPSEVRGDVTLKDINQRILTPPPPKPNEAEEDPAVYPTSAFSGKPVVGKTKIPTLGGKGSITIMRTKG